MYRYGEWLIMNIIYRVVKYTYDCIFGLLVNPLKHLCYLSVLSLSVLSDVEEYK